MTVVFVVCAAVGTTVLVLQFLLGLVGLGGDALGVDVPHDFGHDVAEGITIPVRARRNTISRPRDAWRRSPRGPRRPSTRPMPSPHSPPPVKWRTARRGCSRALLRTIVAALAFFGLSGLAAEAADYPPLNTLLIAAAVGLGAMYAVYVILQSMAARCGRKARPGSNARWASRRKSISAFPPATGCRKNPDQPPEPHNGIPGHDARRGDPQRGRGRRHQSPRLRYRRGPSHRQQQLGPERERTVNR